MNHELSRCHHGDILTENIALWFQEKTEAASFSNKLMFRQVHVYQTSTGSHDILI